MLNVIILMYLSFFLPLYISISQSIRARSNEWMCIMIYFLFLVSVFVVDASQRKHHCAVVHLRPPWWVNQMRVGCSAGSSICTLCAECAQMWMLRGATGINCIALYRSAVCRMQYSVSSFHLCRMSRAGNRKKWYTEQWVASSCAWRQHQQRS